MKTWHVKIEGEMENGETFTAHYFVSCKSAQEAARCGRLLFIDEYSHLKGVSYRRCIAAREDEGDLVL